MPVLPPLPSAPDAAFDPQTYRGRAGHYAGALDEVRWGYYRGWLHGQIRRALIRKRWFEVVVHTARHSLIVHLQDDGTVGHGRGLLLDRHDGSILAHRHDVGAPLRTMVVGFMAARGTDAFLRTRRTHLTLTRPDDGDAWSLHARWQGLDLDLTLHTDGAPTPSLVIGEGHPPFGHRPGLTQHHPGLRVSGTVTLDGEPVPWDGATAHVAYANAFLPPQIHRDRLVADGALDDGRPLAIALSDGDLHGPTHERTLWIDGTPHLLARVHALRDTADAPTRWVSRAGDVDLTFTPGAAFDVAQTRRAGRVRHAHRWQAGAVRGVLPLPDGASASVEGLRALHACADLRG